MIARKAARERKIRQLDYITKKPSGKYSKPDRPVRDKESRIIRKIQELSDKSTPMDPEEIKSAHADLPIAAIPPTIEDIRLIIKKHKERKSNRIW
ncbi:unnamed protein product [Schistosoma margrebowiei]|uniref:Uncharacterized protein n=1 Tax=Schistosoma margrebowiei TaxID=48269 RepID=A0A183N1H6_9TREM|nr:unnamed protein product [Schistosoma margrebowiei]